MTDDKSQRGGQDRELISLSEDYEVRDWAKKFGVTEDRIKTAVSEVGNSADAVRRYLEGAEAR